MKKFFIAIIAFTLLIVAALAVLYLFRQDLAQYSAESVIMKNLPDYMKIDSLLFDIDKKTLKIEGFALKNPPGYGRKYMAEIKNIICRYTMKSPNILDGISVTEIRAEEPVIFIERLPDGRMNVNEMEKVIGGAFPAQTDSYKNSDTSGIKGPSADEVLSKNDMTEKNSSRLSAFAGGKFNIADIIDITDEIDIYDGKLVITDHMISKPPYNINVKDINGTIRIVLNDSYTEVISVESRGSGHINSDQIQSLSWEVSLDPRKKELTMSNNIEIENIDIVLLEPYYSLYSPVNIYSGRCSGSLIFNFSDGSIGSSNTLRLNGLEFGVKNNAPGEKYWQAAIPDLIKYLQSTSGEVIFDFKIKGPVDNPRFYPGPYLNKALQSMVVNKIAEAIQGLNGGSENKGTGEDNMGQAPENRKKSDTEVVIDVLKGLID